MANKDLFKQAIAEAKSVREAAIANAKEALEETLTPHLKDMLAAKLQEMETPEVEEEVVNESEEVKEEVEETVEEAKKEEDMDEGKKDDDMDESIEEEAKEEVSEELEEVEVTAEEDHDEAEDDSEESEDEADLDEPAEEEEVDGDEDISKLSVDQFKDMIRDIISQEVGGDAPADDMDAGDIEGMGDEAPIEEPAIDAPEEGEEEIDLDELIKELDSLSETEVEEGKKDKEDKMEEEAIEEDTNNEQDATADSAHHNVNRTNKKFPNGASHTVSEEVEEKSELDQALETIETLQKELNEVNILNAKLLYVNKIFKANNLSESQKVNVIAAFDKAETVKEVKLVYETVADNVGTKKETTIKEHKGSASKATGTTASKPDQIVLSEAVLRMQKLAGIIK